MKKTLSIVLALVFVVAAFASFALTADSSTSDPFKLMAIKVTDGAGYSNPYAAVDNAAAYTENQAAYVVVEYDFFAPDSGKYKASAAGTYSTIITSSTMDLSYATATAKTQMKNFDGSITAATAFVAGANFTGFTYDSVKAELTQEMALVTTDVTAQTALTDKSKVQKFFFAFIGVTKAATAGEVKAAMKVSGTKFANYNTIVTDAAKQWIPVVTTPVLVVYDSTGTAKYTIFKLTGDKGVYRVYSGKALENGDPHIYLFDYVQNGSIFQWIGYSATANSMLNDANPVGFTYDGKLVYLGADNKLGTSDDKDLTTSVNDANTFMGFTFATSNPAGDGDFEKKTAGNPVIVTDTYAYVTAAVTTPDDVDIAPTGDFSANIVIVLAASAVLAAAALAFVAKKARD